MRYQGIPCAVSNNHQGMHSVGLTNWSVVFSFLVTGGEPFNQHADHTRTRINICSHKIRSRLAPSPHAESRRKLATNKVLRKFRAAKTLVGHDILADTIYL